MGEVVKTIRVRRESWHGAKVAAAERGVSLSSFTEAALDEAVRIHNRVKTTVVRTVPVTFVGKETGDGRG